MALQNYVDQVGPVVSAAVLNELDQIRNVVTVPVSLASMTVSSTLTVTGVTTLNAAGDSGLTASLTLSSVVPQFNMTETGAAANTGRWGLYADSGVLHYTAITDLGVPSDYITVTRSGGTPSNLTVVPQLTVTSNSSGVTGGLQVQAALPSLWLKETDAAANNQLWVIRANAEQLSIAVSNDDGSTVTNFLSVERTGTTVDSLTIDTQANVTRTSSGVTGGLQVQAGLPAIWLKETDAAANNQLWTFRANAEQLSMAVSNDDGSTVTNFMAVDRTGAVVDGVAFPAAGTTASAANAFLDNAASPANRLLRSTSSLRYKTDVQDLTSEEAGRVLQLRPITYRSTCEHDNKDLRWFGLIAEEVAEVLPRMVHYGAINRIYEEVEFEVEQPDGTKVKKTKQVVKSEDIVPDGVQYDRLVVLLLAKMKQQQAEIDELKAQVLGLKVNKA